MKTQLSTLILLIISFNVYAQQSLWGVGKSCESGAGSIYEINLDGDSIQRIFNFPVQNPGILPIYEPILGADGRFYGATRNGGRFNNGVLYRYEISTQQYKVLYEFGACSPDLKAPLNIIQASDGKLYGTSGEGGVAEQGGLFSYDLSMDKFEILQEFPGPNTSSYVTSLLEVSNGKLYGIKSGGGNSLGTIFSYDPSQAVYTEHAHLSNSTGFSPRGRLIEGSDGKLYTTTSTGGPNVLGGTLISFDPANDQIEVLVNLPSIGSSGIIPSGILLENNGSIYGITLFGGANREGSIFSYDINTGLYQSLLEFDTISLRSPIGGMEFKNGTLYGVASGGGKDDRGGLFSFNPGSGMYKTLYDFRGNLADGYLPAGSIMAVGDSLYGVNRQGGTGSGGVLFSYDLVQDSFTKVLDFNHNVSGDRLLPSLFKHRNGNFYGATQRGGIYQLGSIFKLDPESGIIENVYSIDSLTGKYISELLLASDGNLYGVVPDPEMESDLIFRYNPDADHFEILHQITSQKIRGLYYQPAIKEGPDQRIYLLSTTFGKLYVYDTQVDSFQLLHTFSFSLPAQGTRPAGDFCFGSDGNLYGSTSSGGIHGKGVIYKYDITNHIYSPLFHFSDSTGYRPKGGLTEFAPGILTGMTPWGGANQDGTLFSFNTNDSTFIKWYDFDYPLSTLSGPKYGTPVVVQQNFIYGVAPLQGKESQLFKFNTQDSSMQVVMDMCEALCDHPNSIFSLYDNTTNSIDKFLHLPDLNIYPNPAYKRVHISFSLAKQQDIRISLLDMTGKQLAQTLVQNKKYINSSFELDPYSPGLYLVRIQAGKHTLSRKIVIL